MQIACVKDMCNLHTLTLSLSVKPQQAVTIPYDPIRNFIRGYVEPVVILI